MKHIHLHFHGCDAATLAAQLAPLAADIANLKALIMATKTEFAAAIEGVTAHVAKVGEETRALIARVNDLTAAVEEAGNSSPEMDAALDALKAQVAVVDGLVPDA